MDRESAVDFGKTLCCLISFAILSACGGSGDSPPTPPPPDTTPPTATAITARPIGEGKRITIQFDETMDTTSLVLGGDLGAESDGGTWSTTNVSNDTLTIKSQNIVWTPGEGRTLTVDATDDAATPNALATMNLTYDVYPGNVWYVSSSAADDSGNGFDATTAKRTIRAAIEASQIVVATTRIVVNEGTYLVNSDPTGTQTHVVIEPGLSLYGGYSPDFSARDPSTYLSTISDMSTYAFTSTGDPSRAVEVSSSFTSSSVVDGFKINGSEQAGPSITAGIYLQAGASPTIQNCIITGGAGTDQSYGIYIRNSSSSLIKNNSINGGSGTNTSIGIRSNINSGMTEIRGNTVNGGTGSTTRAVWLSQDNSQFHENIFNGGSSSGTSSIGLDVSFLSTTSFHNNVIYGGIADYTRGIIVTQSSPVVRNNIVHGGTGATNSEAVVFSTDANTTLENNILTTDGITNAYCVNEIGAPNPDPVSLRNNDFYNCATALYKNRVDGTGCGTNDVCITDISTVNSLADTTASNNVSVDPLFFDIDGSDNNITTMNDNDWHFGTTSPASVTAGGLNGVDEGWSFTTGKEGFARPVSGNPWSMGAYAAINKRPFDHTPVAGQACASAGCHDGNNEFTFKPVTHPLTTNSCESCHTTASWVPLLIPIDHSQTTDFCSTCHNNTIATGKGPTHIMTSLECDVCHTTAGWLPAPAP